MYLATTPWWLRFMYGKTLIWSMTTATKEVFLTFDDGPHPTITPFVLDCLKQYNAKATFFCIGKNVQQYPEVYRQILDEGHSVGNHTYNHLNGWKTNDKDYFEDIQQAANIINSKLFRPPYGRITKFQQQQLQSAFKIVMWDVLSGDFDVNLSKENCLQNVIKHAKQGSVIVFHDSEKAYQRLEYALPLVLQCFKEKEFCMKTIY